MDVQGLITKHEGKRASTYLDSMGIPTIGIGHNLRAHPMPSDWTQPLSDDQISQLFQGDLSDVMSVLAANLPWVSDLDEVRQAVIVDMCFNMGSAVLFQFHGFLGLVRVGNYGGAAQDMLTTRWAREVPVRAHEDAKMMSSGLWPDDPSFPS
jgi:lysozyme